MALRNGVPAGQVAQQRAQVILLSPARLPPLDADYRGHSRPQQIPRARNGGNGLGKSQRIVEHDQPQAALDGPAELTQQPLPPRGLGGQALRFQIPAFLAGKAGVNQHVWRSRQRGLQ